MKVRIAVAAFLLVVGLALPLAAVAKRGPPWGFRGHQAVLLEATGNVELEASEQRRTREHKDDAHLPSTPGIFLDVGDEVRVARYSEARLRTPSGDVSVGDGARVILTDKGIVLARGVVDVRLPAGTVPFEVKPEGLDGKLTLRPGSDGGLVRVLADGKSEIRAFARNGSCEAAAPGGDEIAETGKVVVLGADKKPRAEELPAGLEIKASCEGKKLTVEAPAGVQVFAGGGPFYAEGGKVVRDVAAAQVPVLARDLAGHVARAVATCTPDKAGKR